MPIVWPLKSHALALEILARRHEQIHLEYDRLSNNRADVIPVYVSSSGLVNFEFSYFLYESWLYRGRLKSKKTVSTYAECLGNWFDYLTSAGIDWRVCTSKELARYRNWMCGSEVCPSGQRRLSGRTINLRLTVVSEFYKYYLSKTNGKLWSEGGLNDQERYKGLTVRINKRRPRIIPSGKARSIKESMNEVHGLIFSWCLCTGLRIGSVLSLTVSDVERLLNSGGGFVAVRVKGNKALEVYVPNKLAYETERYIRIGRAIKVASCSCAVSDSLFLNSNGAAVTRHGYYKAFKVSAKKVGLDCSPHSTRATYASNLMKVLAPVCKEKGLDSMKVVQALLGHVSVETTKDYIDRITIFSESVLSVIDESANEI